MIAAFHVVFMAMIYMWPYVYPLQVLDDVCRKGLPQGGNAQPATKAVMVVGRQVGLPW